MPLAVHVLNLPYGHSLDELRALLAPEIHLSGGEDVASDCAILVAGHPLRAQILASASLRALVIPWAGMPAPTRNLLLEIPQIAVHNLHFNAVPVAEMAITLLLAAAKYIIPSDRALRASDWTPRFRQPDPGVLVHGKTALVLGYGAIGTRVARMCHGLGMRTRAVRRQVAGVGEPPVATDEGTLLYAPAALSHLLPGADFVIVCLPLTPDTDGLLGAHELGLLPSHAILVNVSRAEIVDEAALYHALRDGTVYAAGLDVWYANPGSESASVGVAPSTYPFHELDNVVMSPHRAGHAHEVEQQRLGALADLLNHAARGQPMPNRVDVRAGY
jgi:phosphoglycerate dehydrogenase-like enzyme